MGKCKPQVWKFNIHLLHAVDFGEFIEAWRYEVHVCREDVESNQHIVKFTPFQYETNMYDFKKFFKTSKHQLGKPH